MAKPGAAASADPAAAPGAPGCIFGFTIMGTIIMTCVVSNNNEMMDVCQQTAVVERNYTRSIRTLQNKMIHTGLGGPC